MWYTVFVNDVVNPTNVELRLPHEYSDWYNNSMGYYNLVGKNFLLGYGDGDVSLCTRVLSEATAEKIVTEAVATGYICPLTSAKPFSSEHRYLCTEEKGIRGQPLHFVHLTFRR